MSESTLNLKTLTQAEAVIDKAHAAGRSMLFEHEVYRILAVLGLTVPIHCLVRSAEEITPQLLARFPSSKVVLKAAAVDVAHKAKAGAVKVVVKDLAFITYSVRKMMVDLTADGHAVEGILVVEFVEYTQDLGNEVLLGFRESDAFGPVISFSKGGSDAEHFARNFSPPNLIVAPIDRKWAQALLYSTKIRSKYVEQGNEDYTEKLIDAGLRFSDLATAFSNFFKSQSRYVLREFEVNPIVFDPYGKLIALDGYAVFEPRRKTRPAPPPAPEDSLAPFFHPNGVAVVGVSTTNRSSPGTIIVENLVKLGRRDVYGINPKGGTLEFCGRTLELHTSLAQIDAPVDLVVVAVPAAHALAAVEESGRKRAKAVILIPGGFSETGEATQEPQILDIARQSGMRLIGPNCLGLIYAGGRDREGINTFFIPEDKFRINRDRQQNVAILSQSGALGLTELHNLRNALSPKAIVSYGNALDIDPSDLITHFAGDDEINVIGCYIEGFKQGAGAKFFHTAATCPKPVIAYKAGRTKAGRKATESHTASIAGEYEVSKAAMKQAGVVVADTMMDHTELIKTFALLNGFKVSGNRVAIIANAGYEKTYAADNLGGLQVASFDEPLVKALEAVMPPFISVDPLLDLTPMADDALYETCLDLVLSADSVDAVLVSIVPHAPALNSTDSEIENNSDHVAARIVRMVHKHKKPVVVSKSVTGGNDVFYNKFSQTLDAGGVPTFLTASRAMKSLDAFIRYHLLRQSDDLGEWLKP